MTVRELILVRHGESTGNVARERAEAAGADVIDIDQRDPDVPLSELGRDQAKAVGHWLAEHRPSVVWSSPYVRARQTAQLALETTGLPMPVRLDERLRDRELGVLDRLTGRGVRARYPDEADRRRYLGKMYYRPPGGESWADVALRLRSFLRDLDAAHGRVLVVCHDAVIMLVRYVLEELTEAEVLDLAAHNAIANCAVTRLEQAAGSWRLVEFNSQDHLVTHGSTPTAHEGESDVHPR